MRPFTPPLVVSVDHSATPLDAAVPPLVSPHSSLLVSTHRRTPSPICGGMGCGREDDRSRGERLGADAAATTAAAAGSRKSSARARRRVAAEGRGVAINDVAHPPLLPPLLSPGGQRCYPTPRHWQGRRRRSYDDGYERPGSRLHRSHWRRRRRLRHDRSATWGGLHATLRCSSTGVGLDDSGGRAGRRRSPPLKRSSDAAREARHEPAHRAASRRR